MNRRTTAAVLFLGFLGCRGHSATPEPGPAVPDTSRPADRPRVSLTIVDTEEDLLPDPVDRTNNRLYMLRAAALLTMRRTGGSLPRTLEELVEDSRMPIGTDSWGTPFRYTPGTTDFELRSAGPDRVFGNRDDLLATLSRIGPAS
jgi:hypothetical protein